MVNVRGVQSKATVNRKQLAGREGHAFCVSILFWFSLFTACCLRLDPSFAVMGAPREGSGVVLGCIFELENNTPIGGATITARNQESSFEYSCISGEDGAFFITSLAPGLYTISAKGKGFQDNSITDYPVRLSGANAAEPAKIGLTRTGAKQSREMESRPIPPRAPRTDSSEVESQLEIRIDWNAYIGAPPMAVPALIQHTSADSFSLIGQRQIAGHAPRQRAPELSSDQILIVVLDDQGDQRDWILIPDPRIIRAESPGPTGELSGQTLEKSQAEFLVAIPRGLLAAKLKFYHPNWNGKEYSLELLGTLALY
jgi:hypothetical protein